MSLKALVEKRNALLEEAKSILDKVELEVRALTNEENSEYDNKIAEINSIDLTIKKLEERAAEFNGELMLDGEYDWGEPVGREVW